VPKCSRITGDERLNARWRSGTRGTPGSVDDATPHAPHPSAVDSAIRLLDVAAVPRSSGDISNDVDSGKKHPSAQAAVAGSHKLRVGGGGRVFRLRRSPFSDVRPQRSTSLRGSLTVLPTKHLFGHTGTMTTRANSRCRQAGRLFILPVTIDGPHLHTGIPAYRHRRAAAADDCARRQNSA